MRAWIEPIEASQDPLAAAATITGQEMQTSYGGTFGTAEQTQTTLKIVQAHRNDQWPRYQRNPGFASFRQKAGLPTNIDAKAPL